MVALPDKLADERLKSALRRREGGSSAPDSNILATALSASFRLSGSVIGSGKQFLKSYTISEEGA